MMTRGPRQLIVTADDLGLSPLISDGIFRAHREGIVTAAALLVNAPATDDALAKICAYRDLQIGLHLGIVEGHSLLGRHSSITDSLAYFGDDKICLHRHWKPFLARYLTGALDFREIEMEFEAQIQKFLSRFPTIPFLNSTQHLHILPGVSEIVIRLCKKYRIKNVRVPCSMVPESSRLARRFVGIPYRLLGERFRILCRRADIGHADHFAGFFRCGRQDMDSVRTIISQLPEGLTELMLHPAFDDLALRQKMPWAYSDFEWVSEMEAACSPLVRERLASESVDLVRY